ncbi:MAG: hypothetical protein K0Q50_2240 [Vampirovibrio sp.]|jgi:hypothetical protein|nr:hypothetical protein [Vampirovibrio sp.]
MNQPTSPFSLGLSQQNPFAKPLKATTPSLAAAPVSTKFGTSQKRYNPFMTALNTDSSEFKEVYGVNRPLEKPMFLGYRDDKPMFGGSRLFILY